MSVNVWVQAVVSSFVAPVGGGTPPSPSSFALRGSTTTTASDATDPILVPYPTTENGDLLVLVLADDDSTESAANFVTPSGWTEETFLQDSRDATITIYTTVADGTETGNLSVTRDVDNRSVFAAMMSFSGADTTSPVKDLSSVAGATGTSVAAPSVTTVEDGAIVVAVMAYDGADAGTIAVTESEYTIIQSGSEGPGSTGVSGAVATRDVLTTAGASGTATFTTTGSDGLVAAQFAIYPAPAAAEEHQYWRVRVTNSYDLDFAALAQIEMASSIGGADLTTTGQTIFGAQRTGFEATLAFNNVLTDEWSVDLGTAPSTDWWAGQNFGSAVEIKQVKLIGRDDSFYEHGPAGWVLEYSDDGTTWTTHWTFEREAPWAISEERTYTATEPALDETAATHWRVFSSYSDNAAYLHIAELEMSETSGGGFSNECSTGAAISGQARSGFPATEAFDGIVSGNNSWGGDKTNEDTMWVGQAFATAKAITEIKINARDDSFEEQAPRTFAVQKSLDSGTTWITVWNHGHVQDEADALGVWTSGQQRTYTKP